MTSGLRRPAARLSSLPVPVAGEACRGGVSRLLIRCVQAVLPVVRFCLICAAQVVGWKLAGLRDLGGWSGRRVPGRVIMAFNALIADQRCGGSRGEPAILVDPVGIPVPAFSCGGTMGHDPILPVRPPKAQNGRRPDQGTALALLCAARTRAP